MKKLFVLFLTGIFLLTLTGCDSGVPSSAETLPATDTTPDPLLPDEGDESNGDEDEINEILDPAQVDGFNIDGTWVLANAVLDDGSPFDWPGDIWLEISNDFIRIHQVNEWGDVVDEGIVSRTDTYEFSVSDKITIINNGEDPARGVASTLRYNPETSLLLHSGLFSANEGLNEIYLHFARE